MKIENVCVIVFLYYSIDLKTVLADYWTDRQILIDEDNSYAIGSTLELTQYEKQVNDILMTYKTEEYEDGFKNFSTFWAGKHFFKAKEYIKQSVVFQMIEKMPKGASLHSHDQALVSQEFVYNLTFKENLYACVQNDDISLHFYPEHNISDSCNWTLVSDLRRTDPNFDNFLKSKLSLIVDDPNKEYPDVNAAWNAFSAIFRTFRGLFSYKPVFEEYFYRALQELYDDNIRYVELRTTLVNIYDLDGNIYTRIESIKIYVEILKKFQKDYPDFFGARFIYAPNRQMDYSTMDHYIETFKSIHKKFPVYVAGFDLVGQEDLGNPLSFYVPELLELRDAGAKFFFHAGETNWNGESTDLNLFDAILLNTTRIGHGFAIMKHPLIARLVKERDIAVEVCPISNQVLKLVSDLRNHPASFMIADGFPIVLSADDPSFWGSQGLSYDWYVTFMAMASKLTDLRLLKQLAINSIKYSSLDENRKQLAMDQWENDWNVFIETTLIEYYNTYKPEVNNIL